MMRLSLRHRPTPSLSAGTIESAPQMIAVVLMLLRLRIVSPQPPSRVLMPDQPASAGGDEPMDVGAAMLHDPCPARCNARMAVPVESALLARCPCQ